VNIINNVLFIYLDDVRIAPSKHWTLVRTAETAYEMIRNAHTREQEMVLSLDHDLGECIPTGYDLLNWLEKDIVTEQGFRPKISFQIHSANPVGRDNMMRAIRVIEEMLS
jgi:hypothetical protein